MTPEVKSIKICHIVEVGHMRGRPKKWNPSDFAGWAQQHLCQKKAHKTMTGFVGFYF